MRRITLIRVLFAACVLACLGAACAQAEPPADDSYKVIYKLPTVTRKMRNTSPRFLNEPVYAMDGKAVVFELSGHLSVVTDGKKLDLPTPESHSMGDPSVVVRGSRLYYDTLDEDTERYSIAAINLITGEREAIAAKDSVEWVPLVDMLSPDARLCIDEDDPISVLDATSGKPLPLPKLARDCRLLTWNKASDGIYLVRSADQNTTQLLLQKVAGGEPTTVVAVKGSIEPDYACLGESAGKLAWLDRAVGRMRVCITDVATGKTTDIGRFEGYAACLRLSPSGRYLLMDCGLPNSRETTYRIYDLSTGKAYTRQGKVRWPEVMPFCWHPTQDKLLSGYAYTANKVELREYTAAGLIEWIKARNATQPAPRKKKPKRSPKDPAPGTKPGSVLTTAGKFALDTPLPRIGRDIL